MTPEDKARIINSHLPDIKLNAQKVVRSGASKERKYIALRVLADEYSETVQPHTPCRKGCSACCYQAVAITEHEARLLEEASGREMKTFRRSFEETHRAIQRAQREAYGSPCPFLDEAKGECEAYEQRPMVCRAHHSLLDSPAPCSTASSPYDAQTVATHGFGEGFAVASCFLFIGEPVGDIREFFPAGTKETKR